MTLRRAARTAGLALAALCSARCSGAAEGVDASTPRDVALTPLDALDLLLVIDNSVGMREDQYLLNAQLPALLGALSTPPDRDGDGVPDRRPVRDLHVGVVSTDLGTPGSLVRGCDDADLGDDGRLNPIRFGAAMRHHEPWAYAMAGYRPDDCSAPDQFPAFLAYTSAAGAGPQAAHDVLCNAALYVNGCGLEQPLEAAYRALVTHRADDRPDNTSPNAGFLREGALLAIVVLTDEDDGSARDCRFAESGAACDDATSVFNSADTRWAASNLNLRFYMAAPCSAQDPTWRLERYVDPRDARRGYLALKPGHPERVVFAAITGVPLQVPTRGGHTDWDALLGAPSPAGPDDFCGRDSATAIDDPANAAGPTSMRQANRDPNPNCSDRTVPACRRGGAPYDPANPPCSPTEQYFAWPARRVAEVARRFDESPLCGGAPCRNGLVTSICADDYAPAVAAVVDAIQRRLGPAR